jgi:DNA-binding transcriptional LysR family regulator
MDLNEILVFARVVQSGSFSAAARLLDMPKSTVSRKVSELEERIGARLIQRTTRKLGLTDAGRIYYEHSARIVAELEAADQAVGRMQAAPRGLLRVTSPLSFAMLGPIVAEYLERHADVQVELVCTDRTVDLVDEGFDVAIRAGALADSTLVARHLGTIKRVLVAAPGYCKKNGTPKTPADLKQHTCLSFGSGATPNVWRLEAGKQTVEIRVSPRLTVNDFDILQETARAGIGIAFMPEFSCADDVRTGRLKHVLAEWCSPEVPVHALVPSVRQLSPKVVAFVDVVRERFRLSTD